MSRSDFSKIERSDWALFVKRLRKICFYLILNDPELTIGEVANPAYKRFNQKQDYCMDGFAK